VPWPLLIVPAETVQLNVGVTFVSPPETFAVKVTGWPMVPVSGQLTLTVGHGGGACGMQLHRSTVTVVEVKAMHPQPSSTSTVTVYVPGATPPRSSVAFGPSPVILPPVVE